MVGAMLLLVVLVVAWVGFRSLTSSQPPSPVQTVNYSQEVPLAKKAATFDLVAPRHLPEGWRATTVSFVDTAPQHWHLGLLTDRNRYVGLEQGHDPVSAFVSRYVDKAAAHGRPVHVAGQPWESWSDSGGDLALVRRAGTTTTLVVGHDVPRSELVSFAAGLR
jgi:hypothetical protein